MNSLWHVGLSLQALRRLLRLRLRLLRLRLRVCSLAGHWHASLGYAKNHTKTRAMLLAARVPSQLGQAGGPPTAAAGPGSTAPGTETACPRFARADERGNLRAVIFMCRQSRRL